VLSLISRYGYGEETGRAEVGHMKPELVRVQTVQTPPAKHQLISSPYTYSNSQLHTSHRICLLHGYCPTLQEPDLSRSGNACAKQLQLALHRLRNQGLIPRNQSCHGRHQRVYGHLRTSYPHQKMAKYSWSGDQIVLSHRTYALKHYTHDTTV
jgi:hypothetical protein